MHTALDALEERLATTNTNNTGTNSNAARTDLRDLYLGLLYSTDTHKMYVNFDFRVISVIHTLAESPDLCGVKMWSFVCLGMTARIPTPMVIVIRYPDCGYLLPLLLREISYL